MVWRRFGDSYCYTGTMGYEPLDLRPSDVALPVGVDPNQDRVLAVSSQAPLPIASGCQSRTDEELDPETVTPPLKAKKGRSLFVENAPTEPVPATALSWLRPYHQFYLEKQERFSDLAATATDTASILSWRSLASRARKVCDRTQARILYWETMLLDTKKAQT